MSKGRSPSRLRLLAAFWCSILACDRATDAWSLRLLPEDCKRPAMAVAWSVFRHVRRPDLAVAQRWAEAEAVLRSPGSVRW